MRNFFRSYVAFWLILFILFSAITITVGYVTDVLSTPSFWIGFVFVVAAFFGQLGCAYMGLKDEGAKKMFYNISLLRVSYSGMIVSFLMGGICMLVPAIPSWVGGLACTVVLAFNILAVIKASAAIEEVARIDEEVAEKTMFIKALTVDANTLVSRAQSDEIKAECKKVYEAIRYSDPMSDKMLVRVERELTEAFDAFAVAVKRNDAVDASAAAKELLLLVEERNNKCKILK